MLYVFITFFALVLVFGLVDAEGYWIKNAVTETGNCTKRLTGWSSEIETCDVRILKHDGIVEARMPDEARMNPLGKPTVECHYDTDSVFFARFIIGNIDSWHPWLEHEDGSFSQVEEYLHRELKGCGKLTKYNRYNNPFSGRANLVTFQIDQMFRTGCVDRAIKSAMGPDLQCHKHDSPAGFFHSFVAIMEMAAVFTFTPLLASYALDIKPVTTILDGVFTSVRDLDFWKNHFSSDHGAAKKAWGKDLGFPGLSNMRESTVQDWVPGFSIPTSKKNGITRFIQQATEGWNMDVHMEQGFLQKLDMTEEYYAGIFNGSVVMGTKDQMSNWLGVPTWDLPTQDL